jgi:hypothetical protein
VCLGLASDCEPLGRIICRALWVRSDDGHLELRGGGPPARGAAERALAHTHVRSSTHASARINATAAPAISLRPIRLLPPAVCTQLHIRRKAHARIIVTR